MSMLNGFLRENKNTVLRKLARLGTIVGYIQARASHYDNARNLSRYFRPDYQRP